MSTGTLTLTIREVRRGPLVDDWEPVTLATDRGEIELRHYPVDGARAGAVFFGGNGGGWDSPGRDRLYPELCGDLVARGIPALRVRYRHSIVLAEATLDVLAALHFLQAEGAGALAVTGHSFGGAVALQAAARVPAVRAVVTLATQGHGVEAAARLAPECAALFIHGTADEVLPVACSRRAFELARGPKRLRVHEGAGHVLDEVASEVRVEVRNWIVGRLSGECAPG